MSNKPSEVQESVSSLIQTTALPVLGKTIQYQKEFAEEVLLAFHDFAAQYEDAKKQQDAAGFFEALRTYSSNTYELIAHRYEDNKLRHIDEILEEYFQASKEYLDNLPLYHNEVQAEARFETKEEDNWRIRLIKYWKRWLRRWRDLPHRVKNFFRKLFRKTQKPLEPWKYKLPLRNLTAFYYREEYALALIPAFEKIYRELAITSQQVWQVSDRIMVKINHFMQELDYQRENWLAELPALEVEKFEAKIQEVLDELHSLHQEIIHDHTELLADLHQRYLSAYERAGTAELPSRRFSNSKLLSKNHHTKKVYLGIAQGWRNTLFALHEDWRIDEEFIILSNHLLYQHYKVREEAKLKIKQAVLPQLNIAKSVINDALEAIEKSPKKQIEESLNKQKQYIDLQLIRTVIPATIAVLYRQALPSLLNNIQSQAKEKVDDLADRRGLVKTNEYNRGIKTSEIDYVSPHQIVSFETLPNLRENINKSELAVSDELAKVQKMINEVGQISYFNLDSALSVFEGEQENKDKAQSIAVEGLQRALKVIEHITESLDEVYLHLDSDVHKAVQSFINELTELKSNDYALELKLRVAKAKALERTRELKQKAFDYIKNAVPYTLKFVRQTYLSANQQLKAYRKQMGIESNSVAVSTEISDFLTESEKSIQQLPYVYQRLFSIRPLDEPVFYEERTDEIKSMQEAFQNWNKGRFASTAIIGEKGSGITTLLNFFMKQSNQRLIKRCQLVRSTTMSQIYTEESLLDFFSELFTDQHFLSIEDIVQYFEQRSQPLIFVFENLEHFYLRRVGGFACLKILFELISKTNKKVFWLCTCTVYAWEYLDKSIRISDYFEYLVELQPFQNQQLREVILKRHRVSGYALVYEPALEDIGRKKFEKMSDEEQQQYLEKEYFNDLNKITAGNFSISQLFWLRSARRVTGDTIYIGALKDYDFSFVKSISLQHVLTLHLLIQHDGLSEEQYKELTDYQTMGTKMIKKPGNNNLELIQLMDDGFIVKRDDVFTINPLLYRQVVNLLKDKNFLH
ncbi:hypothetical protein OKW21_003530 [Catalinimonas alkaloidigena]|uniref:ATP-binding protein n=1 Tax=Catalinimonas alkaloidigena TaxID=1075417 RepID=UPI00240709DC|nr:ATP-binding protein [Catalinimonas alkaloidigena]MDF9798267.1 hypothetical protein [Catalinimonas alkaloidigena]